MLLADVTTPTPLESLLTDVGTFFSSAFSWVDTVFDYIVDSPALLIMVIAIPVAGVAIGYLKRLIRL